VVNAEREHEFGLLPRRHAAKLLLVVLATWAAVWLLIAALKPLTVDPRPPPAGFFVAMLPLMLLVACGPMWGLGGTLIVTRAPDRLVVRRDRPGRRGEPVVVPLRPDAAPRFSAQQLQHRKQRDQGVLYVDVDGRTTRLVDTALYLELVRIAAELNGDPPPQP
jgi:hypothetical protein